MRIDLSILNEYKKEGWLVSSNHPYLPLTIWNYSRQTEYQSKWDYITLLCRGLVTDNEGAIYAGGLKKFFNIEENKHIPTNSFVIQEKLDGSLIIAFWYKNQWVVASKGSFQSDQVKLAQQIFDNELENSVYHGTIKGYTYYFELTGKLNRIVVDYPYDKALTVIAVYDNQLNPVSFKEMESEGFKIVREYDFKDYQTIKQLNWNNSEGFVVKFSNGSMCKIKFEDYLNLHRLIANCTTISVWESLKENKFDEYLSQIPDEFLDKIISFADILKQRYNNIELKLLCDFHNVEVKDKKDFASWVIMQRKEYQGIYFNIWDKKDYSELIWKIIKPEYKKL